MERRTLLKTTAAAPAILRSRMGAASDRPNILWILAEDIGPWFNCYGTSIVRTPNLDKLAASGVRYTRAFTTAPVCSASRSAFNVGLYQIHTGAHHHRSHRKDGFTLPPHARLISERMRDAGYFTCNVRQFAPGMQGSGKTDYNFTVSKPWDGTHWNQRKEGQPFYAQVNFTEPHKGPAFVEARKQKDLIDPAKVPLPPYFPDHPTVRDEVANFYDAINLLDKKVGVLLETLDRDKVLDNTVVFMMGDNGTCLIRGKQWCYTKGVHVPMMLRWPGVTKPGTVNEDLTLSLDMTATSLMAAGIPIPEQFHGTPLVGPKAKKRDHLFTARDRCDMTVDRIRSVRDKRYNFIRNFMPDRPYTQYNEYILKSYPTLTVMKQLHEQGKLNATQQLFMAPRKPDVELYDLQSDPHEVNNLAARPEHRKRVADMDRRLQAWLKQMDDKGAIPEKPEAAKL
ncbi:MAG: sulfatase [Candidatus Hydrogenedentes bacterium]|nr:sulfatase [Candidatus Hydrogenedentota bacterium]